MSDAIKHECGIAFIRLLKPLSYYAKKYNSPFYGLKKIQLLMQKQVNRGQDGAGLATIKLHVPPGSRYISRQRSNSENTLANLFNGVNSHFKDLTPEQKKDTDYLMQHVPFFGELMLGHLRYGTYAKNTIEACHPFLRQNNWRNRNLVLAGNFNLTNVDSLFKQLLELGQHPKEDSDSVLMLEKIGHFLDDENQTLFEKYHSQGYSNAETSQFIADNLNVPRVLQRAFKNIDGGYAMVGMIGQGDAFVIRDPAGIRPAFYYQDDEIVVVASERPAIQTVFNVPIQSIKEVKPAHALWIKRSGVVTEELICEPLPQKSCSFERIYFSRGNDADIYLERKTLGRLLAPMVAKHIDYDFEKTVFSYIPNTAATAFYGMIDGLQLLLNDIKKKKILEAGNSLNEEELDKILALSPRREKIAVKDVKLRTFITDDAHRDDLVGHVYDVTYGIIKDKIDTLVVIDDSIVRGTTLKRSILRILDRLEPKKILVLSSSPQIRYPDCYGIDMSRMKDFIAFQALISLIKKNGHNENLESAYQLALDQIDLPDEQVSNVLQSLYQLFSDQELSDEIAVLLKPSDLKAEIGILFQSIENLHVACPNHSGDWYFSGDYPTPGGFRVVNKAFINYMQGLDMRAY